MLIGASNSLATLRCFDAVGWREGDSGIADCLAQMTGDIATASTVKILASAPSAGIASLHAANRLGRRSPGFVLRHAD